MPSLMLLNIEIRKRLDAEILGMRQSMACDVMSWLLYILQPSHWQVDSKFLLCVLRKIVPGAFDSKDIPSDPPPAPLCPSPPLAARSLAPRASPKTIGPAAFQAGRPYNNKAGNNPIEDPDLFQAAGGRGGDLIANLAGGVGGGQTRAQGASPHHPVGPALGRLLHQLGSGRPTLAPAPPPGWGAYKRRRRRQPGCGRGAAASGSCAAGADPSTCLCLTVPS
ncbi:unnamed protein product [Caretta caretta]